jgi:hypothetical protein
MVEAGDAFDVHTRLRPKPRLHAVAVTRTDRTSTNRDAVGRGVDALELAADRDPTARQVPFQ